MDRSAVLCRASSSVVDGGVPRSAKGFPQDHQGRTGRNRDLSYSYAGLPDIIDLVKPKLHKNGLTITQSIQGSLGEVAVETRIHHTGGHVEVFGPLVLPAGRDAQAAGSAITYARRYALCAALGIAPDEDDDGAKASEPCQREHGGNGCGMSRPCSRRGPRMSARRRYGPRSSISVTARTRR